MTSRFPTKSTAVVTTTTVDSIGATQGARGVPVGPASADRDRLGRAASPLDSQQLATELFSGIRTLPPPGIDAQGAHCLGRSHCPLPAQRVLRRGCGEGSKRRQLIERRQRGGVKQKIQTRTGAQVLERGTRPSVARSGTALQRLCTAARDQSVFGPS